MNWFRRFRCLFTKHVDYIFHETFQYRLPFGSIIFFVCAKCCRIRVEVLNEKEIYDRWADLAFKGSRDKDNTLDYFSDLPTDEELREAYREFKIEPVLNSEKGEEAINK